MHTVILKHISRLIFNVVVFFQTGFLDSEPLKEADEDLVSEVSLNNSVMTEEERDEIQQELAKVCTKHTQETVTLNVNVLYEGFFLITLFFFSVPAQLEEEISTLKQVLSSKEKQHAELKQKLGITPFSELKTNFSRGWQDMQSFMAYVCN